MQLILNKRMKFHWVQTSHYNKLRAYFVVYFQITLVVVQRHSSVLVNKIWAFYVNELSTGITALHLLPSPFDQMEPSHSMKHRSGNPVHTGFYEWVHDRLMTKDYKQYFASSGVYYDFWLLFQAYFKSSRSVKQQNE